MMHPILQEYQKNNAFGKVNELQLEIISPGTINYRMKVQEKHLATPLTIHGGMLSALMDAVLGVAALSLVCESGRVVSTVEFKINFMDPVHLGDELVAVGQVDQQGKRILVCSGVIKEAKSGKTVAKGLGTFNAYPFEKVK